jgi:hypothetical protein
VSFATITLCVASQQIVVVVVVVYFVIDSVQKDTPLYEGMEAEYYIEAILSCGKFSNKSALISINTALEGILMCTNV